MKTTFTYYYLSEYLPKRYNGTGSQILARQEVYKFKDGHASSKTYDEFIQGVREIIGNDSSNDYCVCFIPASTRYKSVCRYFDLASKIRHEIGCNCNIDIICCDDHESGHIVGKTNNPTAGFRVSPIDFRGKKVILIDDVITRGRTFRDTANLLLDNGAQDVVGLFLAKTINPDWVAA